ncbi:right-handed parallel beta-helix repeat-containing protein [Paenibacillus sp. IB182496]|uniref:Right-handed parallel beta-helix repeat-containing protein n=1 Tax=Paenibacillus sabuli TaxID=2772509 RepID=A0A927GTV3_9BACL|nr:right-handed parallel beta-helix repeat-containing protein [Paenibacillus sabuli]MBD2847696.1 right-handed parallel beta-helix repeat-containing protein [Paenibacillus sabuli]
MIPSPSAQAAAVDTTSMESLQQLVDEAPPGSVLLMPAGRYRGTLTIAKPLTLASPEGEETALIGDGAEPVLIVAADDVSVSGLHIEDEQVKDAPTVEIRGDRVMLAGLRIVTASHGIWLRGADESTVRDTSIEWSERPEAAAVTTARKGNGIDLYESHRAAITGNTIRRVHDGIYMENSDETQVLGNVIEDSRYGAHCMYTAGTVIRDNVGERNVTGAMVMAVRDVTVERNRFAKQSENVNSQGILLYDAAATLVQHNVVEGNRVGVYIESSAGNTVRDNRVYGNFVGMQLLDAQDNALTHNAFVGNVTGAQARSSADNRLHGNYWDDFQGVDTDGDGYSELPYAINPFFAGLIQKRPAFQLLFQAPGTLFVEQLYQVGRAAWSIDEAPLMHPPQWDADADEGGIPPVASGMAGAVLLATAGLIIWKARRK